MSDIVDYGHQLTTALVILVKPDLTNAQFDPIHRSDEDPTPIGYQHLYHTPLTPSTRLQLVFINETYPGFTIDSALLKDKVPQSPSDAWEQVKDNFGAHPDPSIAKYLEEIFAFYEPEEGVDVRIVPWVEEIQTLQQDNEFAGLPGLFFPVIHIHLKDIDWAVIVRCEPVVDLGSE